MRMASRGPYSERACETIQLSYFFIKLKKKIHQDNVCLEYLTIHGYKEQMRYLTKLLVSALL